MAMSHFHEWYITASFIFSSLKMGTLTFNQRLLPKCADVWLLHDVLITVKCTELWSLPLSELPPPEEGEPLGEPLWILGALCHLCHLPCPMEHQVQTSPVLLTSLSDAPSSRHCIQSSTLQVPNEDWIALSDPWGCPSSLAFVFFSMTASATVQGPSCIIFAVTSICVVLPAN